MARPTKQGIDYFPIDTEFDDDLQLLIAEIGADGLGILLTIWQAIYKANGYYIKCDDKFPLKIKQKCFSCVENIVNVVEKSIDFEIFDKDMYDNYHILTSRGIQKRYFTASRAKKQIEIIPEFILIDVSNVGNVINIDGNGVFNGRNATKEEEEVKEEVKEKKKKDIGKFINPTVDEIIIYCKDRKNNINPQTFIDHYTSNGWMVGKNKMKDWKAAIRTWEQRDNGGNYGQGTTRGTGSAIRKAGVAKSDGEQWPCDAEY